MKTREDIESYLLKLGVTYEDLGHDVWRIKDDGFDNLLVSLAGPASNVVMAVMLAVVSVATLHAFPALAQFAILRDKETWGPNAPGVLYNSMIHPIAPYGIAGMIWNRLRSPRRPTAFGLKPVSTWAIASRILS